MYRAFISLFSLVLSGLVPFTSTAAQTDNPPNVVLIISDDQAWTDFGFMGHPHIQTPHIDRLASQSLAFTRGYVPASLCRPSLASMVTGLYPHQHNIVGNDPAPPKGQRPWTVKGNSAYDAKRAELITHLDLLPTLPRLLRQQNYLSHQSGKWWEGSFKRGGFTHGMTEGFPNPGGRHGDQGLSIGREGLEPITDFIDLAQNQNRPFFVWYAPFLPHRPHNPPDRLLAKYRNKTDSIHVAKYWAMCEWFDETVGQLLGFLDDQQLSNNTLVLFVVDNGWIQRPDNGGYALRSKRSPNEGGTRTPILVRWRGHITPHKDESTPVSSLDLAPTILHAAGLTPTDRMPGLNLLDDQALPQREAIFGEIFYHDIVSLDAPVQSLKYRWCIRDQWKLILPYSENLPDEPVQLYNLNSDPHENHNLSDEYPETVQQLKRRIEDWWPLP